MFESVVKAIESGFFDVPFYKEIKKIDLSKIKNREAFLNVPFTVKDDLRNTSPYIRSNTVKNEIYGLYSSNGTTGKKTFYVYSKADREKQAEFVRQYYNAIEMKEGGLGGVLGHIGSPVMGHCMMWQFQAMNMGMTLCPEPSPENIIELVESLPITDIATLPQVASSVAFNPEQKKIAQNSTVERLVLGGDFLSEARRKLLEETWNAKVYNSFGMSEVFGPIANECCEQNGFHYIDKDLYIEVISPETGKPVEDGEVGIGVYTTLWNKGFPLLRYWSGDLIRLLREPCGCGSKLPRFEYIGRECDCLRLSDGKIVSPKAVEEITLSHGLPCCCLKVFDDNVLLEYDENYTLQGAEASEKLERLFERKIIIRKTNAGEIKTRGLKPKYIIDCRN